MDLEIAASDCSLITADDGRLVEPGSFNLLVGPSSRASDLFEATFTILD